MQWRMLEIQATEQNVDFPIAFTEWCVACGSRVTGTGGNPTTLGANAAFSELATLTHAIVFSVETQDYYLLAAGVQQWGLSTGRTITYPISLLTLYSIVALDAASGMDAVQVCDVNTADNTNAIIFQMRLTQGDILPDNMTGFYWILIGRVQQWGTFPYNSNRWTYPIAFNLIFAAVKTTISDNTSEVGYPAWYSWSSDVTNTYAPHISSYKGYAIALGMQQWGDIVDGTNTFTVAFTSFCKIANAGNYSWGGADNIIRSIELTYFTATYTDNSYPFLYIAIGQQQWGFHNGSGNNIITLLLPYKSCYTPLASSTDTYSGNLPYVLPVGSRQNAALSKLDISSAASSCYWLTIGYQQWGYGDALKWPGLTIELPIPFSNSVYATVAMGCPTTYFWDYPAQIKLNGLTEISYGVQQGVSGDKMFWLIIGQQRHKGYWHSLYW